MKDPFLSSLSITFLLLLSFGKISVKICEKYFFLIVSSNIIELDNMIKIIMKNNWSTFWYILVKNNLRKFSDEKQRSENEKLRNINHMIVDNELIIQ